jgi:Tfp pilus assembly PilM family ATPase
MRNIEIHKFDAATEALAAVITKARIEERKDRALAVSERLVELAVHVYQKGLSSVEAADLIRREAERYQNESQELH